MKLNKKRKDARLPNWLLEVLGTLQIKYQWTFTEALIRTAEKGSVYYNKQWDKMHGKSFPGEARPAEAIRIDERCPNEHQDNDKPKEKEDKEIPDIMLDLMLVLYFNKEYEELSNRYNETISKPYDEGKIDLKENIRRCNTFIKEHQLEKEIKKLQEERTAKHKKKAE